MKVVRLEQNYRSTPQILAAADFLIQHNSRRKAKTLLPTRDNGAPIRFCIYPQDRDEANHIADQIQQAMMEEGRSPKDFAILYRTNAQSRLLEQALMSRRIGYQLIGGFRFYQRQEIKDLLAYLTLLTTRPTMWLSLESSILPFVASGPKLSKRSKSSPDRAAWPCFQPFAWP